MQPGGEQEGWRDAEVDSSCSLLYEEVECRTRAHDLRFHQLVPAAPASQSHAQPPLSCSKDILTG